MIRAIAVDDEPPALEIIRNFCADSDLVDLQQTFTKPNEALRYLKKFPVDLLLLDIQMPSLTGLDFVKQVEQNTLILFTTAHSQYAVEGFNLNAVDYLLKPFTFERFQQAIIKANDLLSMKTRSESNEQRHLLVRADYSLVRIEFSDIQYIEALDDYLKIM